MQRRGAGPFAYFFLLFFVVLLLTHSAVLDLPYFWDEMGQFIPASLDILRDNAWIPRTTLPNVHPPGAMAYLASVWAIVGYSVVITRIAMLAMAAMGVVAVFALAVHLSRPLKGMPDTASAADAPSIAGMSGSISLFKDITVAITCTSFVKPVGTKGRKGRSISREVKVSFSVGRPSRLKKPPGILPPA